LRSRHPTDVASGAGASDHLVSEALYPTTRTASIEVWRIALALSGGTGTGSP
jgi:hypothetical protein